jgi:hypothetical protein
MKLAVAPHEAANRFCLGAKVGSYLCEIESGRKRLVEQRLKLGFLGHVDFHEEPGLPVVEFVFTLDHDSPQDSLLAIESVLKKIVTL